MRSEPDRDQLRFRSVLTVFLVVIAGFGATDLLMDGNLPWSSAHAAFELGFVCACLVGVAWIWAGWERTQRALGSAERMQAATRADRDRWRKRASTFLEGLSVEIDAEFEHWGLTPKEREIALLLLKGYGLKEIADLHDRSERTVRQQAGSVYKKAGLAGRAELSGYFLEDLLLPRSSQDGAGDRHEAAE
jgi:DNA-binding CsgD family transcriptional regulator